MSSVLLIDPLSQQPSSQNLQFLCNQIIDDSNPSVVYIGYSVVSGDSSSAIWRILRIKTNATTGFKESFWAYDTTANGGVGAFNKIFDDRASYSY
jgi:hypothetical protein